MVLIFIVVFTVVTICLLATTLVPKPRDLVDGRAYGADLVGHFDQSTGSFGPSGFYANFYDEK